MSEEDTSVRSLKSRFEAAGLKARPPVAPKPSAHTATHAQDVAKPALRVKPLATKPSRMVAAESPNPLERTQTNDSVLSDPFGSPLNSPAINSEDAHSTDSQVTPGITIQRSRFTEVLSHSGDHASEFSLRAPQQRDARESFSPTDPIDVPRSNHHRPPPPPSPRVRSPRPMTGRSSLDLSRPSPSIQRNIFADHLNPEHDRLIDPDTSSDRSRVRPLSRTRTPASRPTSRPTSRNGSLSSSVMGAPPLKFPDDHIASIESARSARSYQHDNLVPIVQIDTQRQAKHAEISDPFDPVPTSADSKPALPLRPASSSIQHSAGKDSGVPSLQAAHKPQLPARVENQNSMPPPVALREARDVVPRLPSRTNTVDSSKDTNESKRISLQHDRFVPEGIKTPDRRSLDTIRPSARAPVKDAEDSEDEEDSNVPSEITRSLDQPDVSTANRKPPRFRGDHWDISTGKDIRKTAISGDLLMIAHPDKLKLHNILTNDVVWQVPVGDTRVTSMDFRTVDTDNLVDSGRFLWVGFRDGSLHELDVKSRVIVERYFHAHSGAIIAILRHGRAMWTLDELGNLQIWSRQNAISLKGRPQADSKRTVIGVNAAVVVDGLLWIGSGRAVHVFDPLAQGNFRLTSERGMEPNRVTGLITCVVHVHHQSDLVFFGHDDGKISVYGRNPMRFIEILSISHYNLSSLVSVGDYLWAAFKTGKIFVYDIHAKPWRVMKEWTAHRSPILELSYDRSSLWREKRMQVSSMAADGVVKIWDGLLMDDWMDAEMQKRVKDFSSFDPVTALVCTWNAGASVPQKLGRNYEDSQFIETMIRQADSPDFIVFGFQELVDLDNKGKASRSVAKNIFGKKKEKEPDEKAQALAYQQWQNHLEKQVSIASSSKDGYSLLQVRNLVGLFTCLFVKQSLRPRITNIEATSVKTGLKGRYGNKGGIVIRLTLDDTSLCFINCHLAAGQKHVMGRNNDVFSILDQAGLTAAPEKLTRKSVFVNGGDGSMVLDHEICILNGDLNYRINGNRSQVLQNVREGKLGKLLESDQLLLELRKNATHRLRSFTESDITFPPTYKYDPGTDNYDSSEKMRIPAWCDRIYFRGAGSSAIEATAYQAHVCRVSDHRPVSVLLRMQVKTVDQDKRRTVQEQVTSAWVDLVAKTIVHWKCRVLRELTGRSEKECRDALRSAHGQAVSDAALALTGR